MKLLLLVVWILSSTQAIGQIQMKNNLLIEPDSAVAYLGMANILRFVGKNDKKKYTVLSEGDTVQPTGKWGYVYFPKEIGEHTLQLYRKKKLIQEFTIRAERLKRLNVNLGELRDSIVSKYDLMSNLYFKVDYLPQLKKPCTHVIRYDLTLLKANGDTIPFVDPNSLREGLYERLSNLEIVSDEFENEGKDVTYINSYISKGYDQLYEGGSMFSLSIMEEISMMESGDVFWIKQVTLQCPSCISSKFGVNLKYIIE